MRPMFFERPVVAARPANTSEVGVHARPIGKGISSGTVCAPRVSSSCVHRTIILCTILVEHLIHSTVFRPFRNRVQSWCVLAGNTFSASAGAAAPFVQDRGS